MEENAKSITVSCVFRTLGMYYFIVRGNTSAADRLCDKLDKQGVGYQRGNLFFEFREKGRGIQRIERKGVLFRAPGRRTFITIPENFEALNVLKNKIVRKGVTDRSGRLGFEFIPMPEENPICVCRHSVFVHRYYTIGCAAAGCRCQKYREKEPILIGRRSG